MNPAQPARIASRLWLAAVLIALFAAMHYGPFANSSWKHWFANLTWSVAALAVALACWNTARRLGGRERIAWILMGAGIGAWFAGMLVWDYLELVVGRVTPFPALSDLGFLALAPLTALGLVYLRAPRPFAAFTTKEIADFGILTCAILLACIIIYFQPLRDPTLTAGYKAAALAYPTLYIGAFLFALLAALHASEPAQRRVTLLVCVSLGVHALTNTFYARSLLERGYQVGDALDVAWLIAFALMYAAALAARPAQRTPKDVPDDWRSTSRLRELEFLLPSLALIALGPVAWAYRDNLDSGIVSYLGPLGVAFAALLALREWAVHRAEARLADEARAAAREVNAILDSMIDTFFRTDRDGRIVRISASVESLLGYVPRELIGRPLAVLCADGRPEPALVGELERRGGVVRGFESRLRRRSGGSVWVSVSAHQLRDAQGNVVGVEGTIRDVTERKEAEAEMAKLSSALKQTADLVMITDREGIIEYVNPAFEQITGYTRAEVVGRRPNVLKSGKQEAGFYRALWQTIQRGETFNDIVINRKRDGSFYYEAKSITPLRSSSGEITHFVSTGRDITDQMQAQERLHFLAHHDSLTELPNRALLLDRLQQSLARARWHRRLVAVLFMDLDRFKTINDSLGHDAGDRLLQEVGARLRAAVRDGDTIARHGGDEFVVLLDDVAAEGDIALIAQKLLAGLAPPFTINGHVLHITASVGISSFPADGEDSQTLLRHADIAMYRAKEAGKNTFKFYSEEMSARALERLTLENSLRYALERGEFALHYQPQIDIATGAITGVEALLRWTHPALGAISPGEFVPLLEETGLILPVGTWVLREACAQLSRWQQAARPGLRVAVNLSARQFEDPALPGLVRALVEEHGLDPATLELEMTESVLMRQSVAVDEALHALNAIGVRLAIDDFGTGYSSLSYLKRFPIDTIKIDRSFTRDVIDDPDDAHIVAAILGMGASLEMEVIAEGVETEAQRDFLRRHGCRFMQGYLFARPMPAGELALRLTPGQAPVAKPDSARPSV